MSKQLEIRPMLAKKFNGKNMPFPCFMQPKLNGVRAMWIPGQGLMSRDGKFWIPSTLPEIFRELENIPLLLDGELYSHGLSLQQINGIVAVNRVRPHQNSHIVTFNVFDIVSLKSFKDRVKQLETERIFGQWVVPVMTLFGDQALMERAYSQWRSAGYEGLMLRDPMSPYGLPDYCTNKENRWPCLLKRKEWLDLIATLVDVCRGKGKYENTTGSLTLMLENGKTFSAGSGLTDAQREFIWANRHQMSGKKVRVKYEMLSDKGVPLKPTVIEVDVQ